jgi:hypothetical protein
MHGAEGFPNHVGRDLDLLVAPKSLESFSSLTAAILRSDGWDVSVVRLPWDVNQVIASRTEKQSLTIAFEADFVARQVWCGVPLAIGPPRSEHLHQIADRMWLDAWGGFVKGLLVQSLAGNWSKLADRREEWALGPFQESVVRERLAKLAGPGASNGYLEALRSGDESALIAASHRLKRQLLIRHSLRPASVFRHGIRWAIHRRRQRGTTTPRAPLLLLAGCRDISNEELRETLHRELGATLVFPGIRVMSLPAGGDSRKIRDIRHLSAIGVLVVLRIDGSDMNQAAIPWFPAEGVARAYWSGAVDAGTALGGDLMARFHALHRTEGDS